MKRTVIGNGQIARALYLSDPENTKLLHHQTNGIQSGPGFIDITNRETFEALHHVGKGDAVINTAAIHDLKQCGVDPRRTWDVNVFGPMSLAAWCKQREARFVHLSTDYVFDGNQPNPAFSGYRESDTPDPVNLYGESKLHGEQMVQRANDSAIIVRTASVMSLTGSRGKGDNNFYLTCIRCFQHQEKAMEVDDDVYMSPTFADVLAEWIRRILWMEYSPDRIFHVTNYSPNKVSWFNVAHEIWRIGTEVCGRQNWTEPVPRQGVAEKDRPKRPKNTRLRTEVESLGVPPSWKYSLTKLMIEQFGDKK